MTPVAARNALAFLQRINLTPAEIGPFLEVQVALQEIASPKPKPVQVDPMPRDAQPETESNT